MIKFSLKKAIAPVIAVTLLLVTAVLSAVFFQTWFQTEQVISQNILTQTPGNTSNKIFHLNTNLYWVRNLSLIGMRQWAVVANATYSGPIWNESTGTYTWPNGLNQSDYPAFSACVDLDLDGYTDWRIPTQQELLDLGEDIGWNSTNFGNFEFEGYPRLDWFWTGTEVPSPLAFYVNLNTGGSVNYDETVSNYVACVRRD